MGHADPLRHKTIETVRTPKGLSRRSHRNAIDTAIQEAHMPRGSGRRHMRRPLSVEEQEHHQRVNNYLRRRVR